MLQMCIEDADVNILKSTLSYNFAVVAEAELFEWVDCALDKKEIKIAQIFNECKKRFPGWLVAHFSTNFIGIKSYPTISRDLKVIRLPIVIASMDLEGHKNVRVEIKIRINPCLALNFSLQDIHHSKVWVIIRLLDKINLDGATLAENVVANCRKIARELLASVRPCYLKALRLRDSKDVVYRISMNCAALDEKFKDISREYFLNLRSGEDAIEKLNSNKLMAGCLYDLIRFKHTSKNITEEPIEALRYIENRQMWLVGGEEYQFEQIARITAGDDCLDWSALVNVPPEFEDEKSKLLYASFKPHALRLSWSL